MPWHPRHTLPHQLPYNVVPRHTVGVSGTLDQDIYMYNLEIFPDPEVFFENATNCLTIY